MCSFCFITLEWMYQGKLAPVSSKIKTLGTFGKTTCVKMAGNNY